VIGVVAIGIDHALELFANDSLCLFFATSAEQAKGCHRFGRVHPKPGTLVPLTPSGLIYMVARLPRHMLRLHCFYHVAVTTAETAGERSDNSFGARAKAP
jgi:hypothetical protein